MLTVVSGTWRRKFAAQAAAFSAFRDPSEPSSTRYTAAVCERSDSSSICRLQPGGDLLKIPFVSTLDMRLLSIPVASWNDGGLEEVGSWVSVCDRWGIVLSSAL